MKKVLFYVVFAAVTFVVTLAILSQRLDTNYIIERDIEVKAPIAKIFAEIGDLKKWPDWSPWKKNDPSMQYSVKDDKGTAVGDSASWTSNKSGNGTMTITSSSMPNEFTYNTKIDKWSTMPVGEFHLIRMSDAVRVVWTMRGTRGFVDKIFWTLFKVDDAIKKDFDEGLLQLKVLTESQTTPEELAKEKAALLNPPTPPPPQAITAKPVKHKKKKKK